MTINALIIDDEQASIDLLKWLIKHYCPEIGRIESAKGAEEAISLLAGYSPDLVFLDIQMPRYNGFDFLEKIETWNFEVIFTTAFNEFAIQAIRLSALDYLLKPIDDNELKKSIQRFITKKNTTITDPELYKNFIQNISQPNKEKFKLAIPDSKVTRYIPIEEIIRLEADGNYTFIYKTGEKSFYSAKTLKEYDEILPGSKFLRVHRSHLVNIDHIVSYDKQGSISMSDGSVVEVSRRKREFVQETLKG